MSGGILISAPTKAASEGSALLEQQQSQTVRVIGVVKDSEGEPIIGVSIMIKGSTVGTVTDIDGNYILNVPSNGTLVFSYIGYKTKEEQVKDRT
ncbi:MAG: carboxypeptidase-like regulatory domain-containing protein, partial [Dysgonomonas sp.]